MVASGRKCLAVLLSGRGSNMEAILKATKQQHYPAAIALVISDNSDAPGLETAQNAGIATASFNRSEFTSKSEFENAIAKHIEAASTDLICLAGFMRLLSADFTDRFAGKLINIHPSLLPKHKGLDTHQRALDAGDEFHGCTVHYVNAEMDGGEIIAQRQVKVMPDDTAESLAARVLKEEHKLYPEVIRQICSG